MFQIAVARWLPSEASRNVDIFNRPVAPQWACDAAEFAQILEHVKHVQNVRLEGVCCRGIRWAAVWVCLDDCDRWYINKANVLQLRLLDCACTRRDPIEGDGLQAVEQYSKRMTDITVFSDVVRKYYIYALTHGVKIINSETNIVEHSAEQLICEESFRHAVHWYPSDRIYP